ncbi:N/A [soil metagenome]
MTVLRFRPSRDLVGLHNAMQRLLDDAYPGGWSPEGGEGRTATFQVDLYDTQDALELRAEIPGAKSDDIEISVTGNTVSIRAEVRNEREAGRGGALHQECFYGTMQRSFTVPTQIDAEKVEAAYEDGVLKVRLPKSDAVRAKKVSVRGGPAKSQPIDSCDGRRTEKPSAGWSRM